MLAHHYPHSLSNIMQHCSGTSASGQCYTQYRCMQSWYQSSRFPRSPVLSTAPTCCLCIPPGARNWTAFPDASPSGMPGRPFLDDAALAWTQTWALGSDNASGAQVKSSVRCSDGGPGHAPGRHRGRHQTAPAARS